MKTIKLNNCKMTGTFAPAHPHYDSDKTYVDVGLRGMAEVNVDTLFEYFWKQIISKITTDHYDYYTVEEFLEGNPVLRGCHETHRGSDITITIKTLEDEELDLYLSYKYLKNFIVGLDK